MGATTLTRTTFDAVQRRIPGAEFATWEGWDWIAGFGNAHAEHRAVRTACGVWDESPLQKWALHGRDALVAADRCFTNDMRSLRPGQLRYGAFCDDDGRMLGDGTVFAFAPDRCWVVTALESDGEALREAVAGLEVALSNHTRELPHLQLQGPRSRALLERLCGLDLSGLGYYRFLTEQVELAGLPVTLARCGYSGELGYELYVSPDSAEALWRALLGTGQVTPYGLSAVETLRQESGLIFIDADYFPGDTDPYEMNLDHVIRLEKPAFRGQQALRRIAAAPARRLTTVTVSGDEPAVPGGEVRSGGEPVGQVRSACWSPTLERLIAMVVIDAPLIGPGARFDVELEPGGTAVGVVGDHPIYDTHKLRPRA
jgi:aminomethyltransferase